MKLRGTLTEQSFRKELQASQKSLFNDVSMLRFLKTLKETVPAMKTAYTLYWIPEQGEDIITFLVDMDCVVTIELDRYDHTMQLCEIIKRPVLCSGYPGKAELWLVKCCSG